MVRKAKEGIFLRPRRKGNLRGARKKPCAGGEEGTMSGRRGRHLHIAGFCARLLFCRGRDLCMILVFHLKWKAKRPKGGIQCTSMNWHLS